MKTINCSEPGRAPVQESAGTDDVDMASCHGADAEMLEMVVMLRVATSSRWPHHSNNICIEGLHSAGLGWAGCKIL